ncbi:hypothetical protein BGZ95_004528 [Linnemannia exigua]|uniref:Uncharacterized protein n=1 Tax=Linnemannia exigua TaxID=604196 RepID=A0AAD4DHA4_9FUNG|nr:hypothetical protein BGZ95_004528 [Linnemannia exigua]
MRGRLPHAGPRETQQQQQQQQHTAPTLTDCDFDPVIWKTHHAIDIPDEPTDEESIIQEHICELKADIQKTLSQPLVRISPYNPSPNECLALLGIACVVQNDMHTLQDALSRCGRPPDQRDEEYIPAPNWDSVYLIDIINAWNEPVVLEPDYYILKAMCLYELGTSVQVSVLGQEKVQKYMNMALTLAQRGERILKTKLGSGDGADRFWRYQTMMSYVYQHQKLRKSTGIQDQVMVDQACDLASRALRCFHRGMRWHPNVNSKTSASTEEPFKDEEWIKMADLADSCFQLANDFMTRQTWYRHTLKLLHGALYENRAKTRRLLELIAKIHLAYAVWIHEQKGTPLTVVPKPSLMFLEMQCASIAGKASFSEIIDALHMLSLACVDPNLIHLYIREASRWIAQLKTRFPEQPVSPSYLYSAGFIASKDRAMQAITQHRQAHSTD